MDDNFPRRFDHFVDGGLGVEVSARELGGRPMLGTYFHSEE